MVSLRSWWSSLVYRVAAGRRFRVVQYVEAADEIPDELPMRGAVVVGSRDQSTWIAFDCPCDERHRVMLNLDARRKPTWSLRNGKPLTLNPSIDERRPGKRCHYFIRAGRVQWAHNTDVRDSR